MAYKKIEQHALTLAVVCVEQRVEALQAEWRAMSDHEQHDMPGFEQQIADEKSALRWLENRRAEAYR